VTLAACTIIARNYLAQARVLSRTFRARHPTAEMLVLVVDDAAGQIAPEGEPFTLVRLRDLRLPDEASLCFKYNLVELCTAVKPFFLEHVFDRYGATRLLYLDPDVWVLDSLAPLYDALSTRSIVLIPHITDPIEDELLPSEVTFLQCGAYNLGFLGLRDTPTTRRMLSWWQRRCHEQCVVRLEQGLFVDQKWIDLVPAMFGDVAIVRDPGYNVAYWNLHARTVRPNGSGWHVNEERLRFFHFSGYDPDVPAAVSRHQTRFDVERLGEGGRLFDEYRALLLGEGYRQTSRWPIPFATFDNGVGVSPIVRHLYLSLGPPRRAFGDPFSTRGPGSFFAWLDAPAPGEPAEAPYVSNLLAHVPLVRTDLRDRFPDCLGDDRGRFLDWMRATGPWQLALDPYFLGCAREPAGPARPSVAGCARELCSASCRLCALLPLLDRYGYGPRVRALGRRYFRRHPPAASGAPPRPLGPVPVAPPRHSWGRRVAARLVKATLRPCSRHHVLANLIGDHATPARPATAVRPTTAPGAGRPAPGGELGVNLIGYLTADNGVGEAARLVASSLEAAGVPRALVNFEAGSRRRRGDGALAGLGAANPYGVNLVHVNADQVRVFAAHHGPGFFAGRYNIGFWMWELADFPPEWDDRFHWFDEIWTPSAFTSEAIARRAPVPVWTSPLPLLQHRTAALERDHFGIPEDRFVFLFAFDFASVFERKNPLGVVEAFRRAFRRDDRVLLVLKCANADADPTNADRLRDTCDGDSVRLLDKYLARPEVASLMHAADAYVSLHRSEGYGLTMAEAMGIGKPVIATGYSGNLQFMDARNSFLVPYRLVEVNGSAGPYPPGRLWAAPDTGEAAALMRQVFEDRATAAQVGERARADMATRLSPEAVGTAIRERLERREPPVGGRPSRDRVPAAR
jgi:glycosyltransferase involved in cell wall biosynthesis